MWMCMIGAVSGRECMVLECKCISSDPGSERKGDGPAIVNALKRRAIFNGPDPTILRCI